MWSIWLGTFLLYGWFALKIAEAVSFPVIIVGAVLILMEIVPILWMVGVIPHSTFIDRSLVGGFWLLGQILICGFFLYATLVLSTNLAATILAILVLLGIGWGLAYFRTLLEIRLLLLYKD